MRSVKSTSSFRGTVAHQKILMPCDGKRILLKENGKGGLGEMLNPQHLREHIIRPTLKHLGLWSESAENLLLGTALVESGLTHLVQLGKGPALGIFQMEPFTHDDIHENFLAYRKNKPWAKMLSTLYMENSWHRYINPAQEMIGNLYYATGMARIQYWRRPEPLPEADDLWALGAYYKQFYTTVKGKGTAAGYVQVWSVVMDGWGGREL